VDAFGDEPVVADIQRARDAVSHDVGDLQRGQQGGRTDHGEHADHGRCRQQSTGPRPVELTQPDRAGDAYLAPEQAGD
jgi:hypothetical protein